ncbi:hypothetical protein [Novilysobacter erysipheiresistens]|uniref:DUF2502 domain-containing protein n=1 Tax=Novilysobacter erysipheiresistens TaxID=1749332 RepID=A0ABU7YZB0_9GAMM
MALLSRLLAPVVFAAGLGMAALSPMPAQAQSGDDLVRVLVDVADVMFRSGAPYYRHGNYGHDDRLIVVRDRYGRPVYYRQVRRGHDGYDRHRNYGQYRSQQVRSRKCNKHGKCKVTYYDPRHDRDRYSHYDRHDRNDRYRWQARQWRDRDDDRDWDDD